MFKRLVKRKKERQQKVKNEDKVAKNDRKRDWKPYMIKNCRNRANEHIQIAITGLSVSQYEYL